MPSSVEFVVGNTYQSIPYNQAKLSSNGNRKIHDIVIFMDVVSGDPDIVEKVSFDLGGTFHPPVFTCVSPVPIRIESKGIKVWRFSTRQQVYGRPSPSMNIKGIGGSSFRFSFDIVLNRNSERQAYLKPKHTFVENNQLKAFPFVKLPPSSKFGIELELTSAMQLSPENIADLLQDSRTEVVVIGNYHAGRQTSNHWKIVSDSSIACNINQPDCNKFELVSPPLCAGKGLGNVNGVLKRMGEIRPPLKVNKSMGFHVHIDVSSLSTLQLIKVCQQFVKYEEVMDLLMPNSRRSGSQESNSYFKSNRQNIADLILNGYNVTNKQIHEVIGNCVNITSLANVMNGSSRYFKLNMQNLVTGRQPTLEFRQHSATMEYEKVGAWTRFCVLFCLNSAKLRAPKPFAENRSTKRKFEALFQFVIKDRALREFYRKRMNHLAPDRSNNENENICCSSCA